jgi:hypothetical protein
MVGIGVTSLTIWQSGAISLWIVAIKPQVNNNKNNLNHSNQVMASAQLQALQYFGILSDLWW